MLLAYNTLVWFSKHFRTKNFTVTGQRGSSRYLMYGSILTGLQVIVQVLARLELTAPNIDAVSDLIIRKLSKILSC